MTVNPERFPGDQGAWRPRAGRYGPSPSWAEGADAPPLGMTGIGAALREAREARGITYATAERETHIPRHHLQALEEERFEALHAAVYVRGFLRSYSQYLGLDSTELLALLPADAPPEDERLYPLSRLGHPRGPREAARARFDPAERDATPLTDAAVDHQPPSAASDGWDRGGSGRMRFGLDAREPSGDRAQTRLDPLGRLGWPEQPGGVAEPPAEPDSEDYEIADDFDRPSRTKPFSREHWHRPLSPRGPDRWRTRAQRRSSLPEDVRPLFSARVLPGMLAAITAMLAFYALLLVLGGGDSDARVLASAAAASQNTVPIAAPQGPATPHATMPNLRGTDLKTAEAALQSSGVVPMVIQEVRANGAATQVTAQLPAAGSALRTETPVVLILGGPS